MQMSAQSGAQHMSLKGKLSYPIPLSDVYGWVSPAGQEYALVGTYLGLSVVSLADPTNPLQVQFVQGTPTIWRDVQTWGQYAYVSNEGGGGILIVDLSGLPNSIVSKDTIMAGITTAHTIWIDEKGYLYVNGPNVFNGGTAIFDVHTDPWHPIFIGSYNGRYVHDNYVRDDIAYNAEINDGRLTILDVSNRAQPVEIGSRDYPSSFTHNTWLNDAGTVVFTTDEYAGAYIHAWDITDPSDIRLLDRARSTVSGTTTIPHNVYVLNDYLVISYYNDGVVIMDASHPDAMAVTGWYDTNQLQGGSFDGVWSAYPYLPSGLILGSDINEGLYVLEANYVRGCYLSGTIYDAVSNQLLDGAQVVFQSSDTVITGGVGTYSFGASDSGQYTITVSKPGYISQTLTVVLDNGVPVVQNFSLDRSPRTHFTLQALYGPTGDPIEGILIEGTAPAEGTQISWVTSAAGTVIIPDLVTGEYQLYAGKWGFRTLDTLVNLPVGTYTLTLTFDSIYDDPFALDLGWVRSGTATAGEWIREQPVGSFLNGNPYNPDQDLPDDVGFACYVTGNGGTSVFGNEVNGGSTVILSPEINLTGYNDPVLVYSWWFVNYSFATGGAGNESLKTELVGNLATLPLKVHTNALSNKWQQDTIRISELYPLYEPFRIRFTTQDTPPNNIVEAGIDGFYIYEADPDTTTSLDRLTDRIGLFAWAAPGEDQLLVSWRPDQLPAGAAMTLTLTDLRGAVLHQETVPATQNRTWLPYTWASGLYLLRAEMSDGTASVIKVVR
ncbi:MAG: choice-of-anchor B family protein [Bacteroidia bacterium]|nr:choice-of-anchor B family protein [Bacteroidia bacterium]